jgi:cobalt-zinc-cadmium efflux system membrane fusion protein
MEQGIKKRSWSFAIAGFVVGLALGAFIYSKIGGSSLSPVSGRVEVKEETFEEERLPEAVRIGSGAQGDLGIEVETVVSRNLQDTLYATGNVSEDPLRVAHIRPLARGIIEKTYVRLGDRVSAGDPLVEYDNIELGLAIGEYQAAQAELRRKLTDLEVKKTILERGREMLNVGAIARTDYDLREAEHEDAEAGVAGARATVAKIADQIHRFGWTSEDLENLSAGRGAAQGLSHSVVKAPFAGIITSYHASTGEAVEPSTELLAITDMSSLWVLADVFEKDLSHVKSGKAVRVRVASYPERVFQGKITYIADAIEPRTRTAKVRCEVENKDGLLKLEMFATVEIPVERTQSVIAVPDSSIQQIDGSPVIFVRSSAEEFSKREVRPGISSGGYTEIISGVRAGDNVVSQGSFIVKTEFLRNLIGEDE